MHILIVSQYFWPENFQINSLARLLGAKKHKVTVLTGLPNYPQGKLYPGYRRFFPFKETWNNLEIIRVPMMPRGNGSSIKLVLNYVSFAILATLYAPFGCKDHYDVIFVFEPSPITQVLPAIFLKKLKKIPVFLWVQDLWPESLFVIKKFKSKFLLKLIDKFVRFIYQRCDKLLIQSPSFLPYIQKHGISADKINYFPNSAEDIYKPLCVLAKNNTFNLPAGFKIIFAGNIGAAQAIENIVLAAEKTRGNQQIKWLFAGEGSERAHLQKMIVERDLAATVSWLGAYSATEMPYLFAECEVLLLALTKNEIFSVTIPSKLQSYLACGKPILAAIDGETKNIITAAAAGLAVDAENSEQLAAAAVKLFNLDNDARQQLGENGFWYFHRHFEQNNLAAQLEQWFKKACEEKIKGIL